MSLSTTAKCQNSWKYQRIIDTYEQVCIRMTKMATGERLQTFNMFIDDFTTRLKVQTVGVGYKVLVFSLRHSGQSLQVTQYPCSLRNQARFLIQSVA